MKELNNSQQTRTRTRTRQFETKHTRRGRGNEKISKHKHGRERFLFFHRFHFVCDALCFILFDFFGRFARLAGTVVDFVSGT